MRFLKENSLSLVVLVLLLGALVAGDWATAVAADPRTRNEASGLVTAYLHWHLERGVRSLRLVDRGTPALPAPPADRAGAR